MFYPETHELSKSIVKICLHLECQLKLLNTKKQSKCSICLGEYTNLNVIIIKKKYLKKLKFNIIYNI